MYACAYVCVYRSCCGCFRNIPELEPKLMETSALISVCLNRCCTLISKKSHVFPQEIFTEKCSSHSLRCARFYGDFNLIPDYNLHCPVRVATMRSNGIPLGYSSPPPIPPLAPHMLHTHKTPICYKLFNINKYKATKWLAYLDDGFSALCGKGKSHENLGMVIIRGKAYFRLDEAEAEMYMN